jgi:hypothetical protein
MASDGLAIRPSRGHWSGHRIVMGRLPRISGRLGEMMVGRFALLNLSRYYILFRSSPNGWRKNTSVFKQFYTSEGGVSMPRSG